MFFYISKSGIHFVLQIFEYKQLIKLWKPELKLRLLSALQLCLRHLFLDNPLRTETKTLILFRLLDLVPKILFRTKFCGREVFLTTAQISNRPTAR